MTAAASATVAASGASPAKPVDPAERRFGVRGVLAVAAVVTLLFAALIVVRSQVVSFEVGFENAGSKIGNLGLALQLAAMIAGVVAIHLSERRRALQFLVLEGAVCLLCYGWLGAIYAAGMLAWYGVLGAQWLPRAVRAVLAAAMLAAMNACAFLGERFHYAALLFSMIFTLRMLMYAWDRWQNELERPPMFDYLVYMLPAPLVVVPPYMIIIPMFGSFAGRFKPGLSRRRVRQIAIHLGLAALFGGLRGALEASGIEAAGVPWMYGHLVSAVITAAAYAHAFIALLVLHGIDERLPLIRPLLATRFTAYWGRYQVHQKDAQVFLFFTPAVLRLRRINRYLALVLAVSWTMLFGNTFIHLASRYCFWQDPHSTSPIWDRVHAVLIINLVMAAGLAIEMCLDERRTRRLAKGLAVGNPDAWGSRILGWAVTMTLAAIASI